MTKTLRDQELDLDEIFTDTVELSSGTRTPPGNNLKLGVCTKAQCEEYVGALSTRYLSDLRTHRDTKKIVDLVQNNFLDPEALSLDENAIILYACLSENIDEAQILENVSTTLLFLAGRRSA